MKRIAIILLLLLISSYEGYCQLIESAGPNSSGLAGLNANNVDVWSINYNVGQLQNFCLLYTSPSPRDKTVSRMPSSA